MSVTGEFQDWIPVRVHANRSDRLVNWCYAGQTRFTHPFFSDTLREILRRPFSLLFPRTTSLESLHEIVAENVGIPPAGFIFHMSRCGSTLVAQMLAAVGRNLVISEAPAIDDVLALSRTEDDEKRTTYLKAIVNALGRQRSGNECNYFVKFDSWHTLDLDLISRAFPDVPWVFLYRDPIEVIVSQMRQRGSQMVPGTIDRLVPGSSLRASLQLSPEQYCAEVLARICSKAVERSDDRNCLLVNYKQLPGAVLSSVTRHFGVEFGPQEIEAMTMATTFDAKTPGLYFAPDTEQKQKEATDAARDAAKLVQPFYNKLEGVRREREDYLR